ncbi:MAG: hypothetical protein AB7F75_06335 [Planctomycetota bacterium]
MRRWWIVVFLLFALQWQIGVHLAGERRILGMDSAREDLSLDPVELVGTRLLSPFRAFMVNALWMKTQSSEIRDNLGQLPVLYNLITSLQPNLVEAAIFAAMNLGMDLTARTDDPLEQWHWIQEGLAILDKSIERNAGHPRLWRLEFQRAYLISQRCLPSSRYVRHGAHSAQMYERVLGRDPRLDAAASFQKILHNPKVPSGWLAMYPGIFESWALEKSAPEEEAALMEKALKAWDEVLGARPDIEDAQSKSLLEAKVALSHARTRAQKGGVEEMAAWVEAGWVVIQHQWLEPQVASHFRGLSNTSGDNLYVALLERRALDMLSAGDHMGVTQICDMIEEVMQDPLLAMPSMEQKIRILRLKAGSHDILAGACVHMARSTESGKAKDELLGYAAKHRRQALSAYEILHELLPDDEAVKTKISLLGNDIK